MRHVAPSRMEEFLAQVQSTGFRDVAGARASARVPVSRALLNRAIAEAMKGRSTPIRAVDVRPRAGDRFDVVVTLSMRFIPPLTAHVVVERQPQFPASPVLVLRWSLLGGLGAMASRLMGVSDRLPPGVRMEADRIVVDIPVIAAGSPVAPLLRFVKSAELHTLDDRVTIDLELEIPDV